MTLKAMMAVAFGYGAGVWFAIAAMRRAGLARRASRWIRVRGRVLESAVYKDPFGQGKHFKVRYEFVVGERIEGSTPRLCGNWFWTDRQQAAFVARFVPGAEVEVFYDPRNPRNNCLDRTDRTGVTVMWILAAGGPVLASLLVWLHGK